MAEPAHDHVVPPRTYVTVLIALMALLLLTVIAAFIDFDDRLGIPYMSMSIALLIAITKALLIILFFMHVKYGTRITWAFASSAFVWLGIMLTLTLSDYFTRNERPGVPISSPDPTPEIMRPMPSRPEGVTWVRPNPLPESIIHPETSQPRTGT